MASVIPSVSGKAKAGGHQVQGPPGLQKSLEDHPGPFNEILKWRVEGWLGYSSMIMFA